MNRIILLLRLVLVLLLSNAIPTTRVYSSKQTTGAPAGAISGPTRPVAWDASQVIYSLQPVTNTAPVAVDDLYSVNEDTLLVVPPAGVLSNDSDPDNDPLTAIQQSGASNGLLTLNLDGSLSYSPNPNFNGSESFTYVASDVFSTSNTATVSITILPVNDPPVANPDTATTPEDTPIAINVATNDTDVDNDLNPTSVTVTSAPIQGSTSTNAQTGIVTYTPNPNSNGPDSFTYLICDNSNACDNAVASITVSPVNDSPQANDDTASTAEDTPVGIDVMNNDSDVDGNLDPGQVTIASGPGNGSTTINSTTGAITYSSNLNFSGADSFTYQVCDTGFLCDTANVAITIAPVNDPPSLVNDTATTPEDTFVRINVLANDTDPEGNLNPSSISITSPPSHGSAQVHPVQRTIDYTPASNYNGSDSLVYQVCDTLNACSTANVAITVNPVNDPPVATDDTASTPEDTAVVISVTGNDTDVDGTLDPASVSVTAAPTSGSTSVNTSTGAITYTPAINYNGSDGFSYQVCDNQGACDTAAVAVTINPANDLPVANNDTAVTQEDTAVSINVLSNDNDPDGTLNPASVSVVGAPTSGSTSVNTSTGAISYTPALNYNGSDGFTYQVCDNLGACDTATVSISITPVNDPPTANNDSTATPMNVALVINVLSNDTDPENNLDPGTVFVLSAPSHGSTSVNATTGAITYTPALNYNGGDAFTYQVCDTGSLCSSAQAIVAVGAPNTTPVANDDAASTPEDTAAQINVIANDTDPENNLDPSTVEILSGPANGNTTVDLATGMVTYTPDPNYNGGDGFAYEVCDILFACDSAVVSVTVTPVNDPPVAVDDTASTAEDNSVTIDVLANDSDVDSPLVPGSVSVSGLPSHGSTSVNTSTGAITYTPAPNYNGSDSFSYQLCEGQSACDTATVFITITPVNDPPTANDDAAVVAEDGSTPISVATNDTDPENNLDPTTVTVLSGPTSGSAVENPNTGVVTYTPNPNYNGSDAFTYQVCDTQPTCDTASVTITVTSVNDPPVANNDSANTAEDTQVFINVPANDTDIENNLNPTSVTITAGPAHGSATENPTTGVIAYQPALNYSGADSFTYRICDSSSACDTADVTINITAVNDPPAAVDDTASTPEDTAVLINILANDADPEGNLNPASVTVPTLPANGAVIVDSGTGGITYTPNPNYHGPDTFVYQVCDTIPDCSTASVNLTITQVNDLPVAVDDLHVVFQDHELSVTQPGVLGNDSDADGDQLNASLVSSTGHGSLNLNANGAFVYTPAPGYVGADSFTYRALDSTGQSNTATVRINVLDITEPLLSWVLPVGDGGVYQAAPGIVDLEVTASDNVGVDYVRFYSANGEIAVDDTAPYRVQVDNRTLNYGYNYVRARAYDDAGNASDSQNTYIYLFGYRLTHILYMPVLGR